MWRLVVVATITAGGLGAAGCGDSEPDPVPLESFSARARAALCDWAVGCRHTPDRATCERLIDPKQYDTRRAEDAVVAGRLGYDADAAARCIEATAAAHCVATPFADESCADMFAGLVATDGGCTSDFECADRARCEGASCGAQCCLGACGPAPTGTPPEPPELAAIGEACVTHTDCVVGAYCEFDRVCQAVPTEAGERCVFGCGRGDLFCDIDLLQCRAYAGLGEACDEAGVSASPCDPAWSFCDVTCTPRPGPGQACDDVARLCIASSYCDVDNVCRPRGSAGAACNDSSECEVACDGAGGQCVEYQTCETG